MFSRRFPPALLTSLRLQSCTATSTGVANSQTAAGGSGQLVKVDNDPQKRLVSVQWANGMVGKFPYIWLRDCSPDSATYTIQPAMTARNLQMRDFDVQAAPDKVSLGPDGTTLDVSWPGGVNSSYPSEWLQFRNPSDQMARSHRRKVYLQDLNLWGREDIERNVQKFDHEAALHVDKTLHDFLSAVCSDGLALLVNGPKNDRDAVQKIGDRIGLIHETHFGKVFEVSTKPNASNMAYANSGELPLHTDFPSLSTPPQLQMLHMIQRADEGGLSVFVDGFHVAEQLRKEHPDVFEILSTYEAEYIEEGFDKHDIDGKERIFDFDMTARHRVIETRRDGSVKRVTFGNAMRSWFYDVDDEAMIQEIYNAMKVFTEYCYQPRNLYQFQLENGETMLWSNTRLLHSRTAFRTINHSRTLMGCYFSWDILKSRMKAIAIVALIALALAIDAENSKPKQLITVTVATEETDGLRRLMRTAEDHGHDLLVFGRGEQWNGGDMRYNQGGGQKIRILRDALKNYKDKDVIIMFVDAYDVVLNANADQILDRFYHEFDGARIVFGAEGFCWPDKELALKYPLVNFGKRYLNSGLYMGYASDLYKMLELGAEVKDSDDDQLFFTKLYLDENIRTDLKIALDSMSLIFQNLNGVTEDVKIEYDRTGKAQLINTVFNTEPVVVHGNGPSKKHLNALANYIGNSYSSESGCVQCAVSKVFDFERLEQADHPTISILAFIYKPVPFVEEFLQSIADLDYDKKRLNFYVYNNQPYNENDVEKFLKTFGNQFNQIHSDNAAYEVAEREARTIALEWANEINSDFAFIVDADAHISNANTLKRLVEKAVNHKMGVVVPMIGQSGKLFTNFWGAVSSSGFYARSDDYLDIVGDKLKGFWNVPFVTSAMLLSREKIVDLKKGYGYNTDFDPDMSFCQYARDQGSFLVVDNEEYYGFLVRSEDFQENVGRQHPEMYEIFLNRELWENRYLHPKYRAILEEGTVIDQPCPDVYDFPLMSERFCAEMIAEMEHFGQWSSGKHEDNRLTGGYENVPTRDIHMNQVGFERHWLYFVDEFVRPVQEKIFTGYYHQPVESVMMFVVRYNPVEQSFLRPHHDASTYSIDIALNKRGRDYEGGGVRYIRYNCTVPADEVGYSMIFPGRLTHLHEGLPTTKGTRYIAVSFLNP